MRLLGRILLLLLIAAGAYYVAVTTLRIDLGLGKGERLSGNLTGTRSSIAYGLDDGQWTVFLLTGHADMLRIVTNAIVGRPLVEAPEEGWLYALDYRLLDGAGRELESGEFYHRTRIRQYRDMTSGEVVNQNAFLTADRVPSDSRVHIMPLIESAAKLMLKVKSMDAPLQAITVRIYEPEQYTELKLDAAWRKLTSSQRVRLARGSVYNPELLLAKERRNLLRNSWKPLGPLGVQGRDYRVHKLFVRHGDLGEPLDQEILPGGLYMDEWHRGIVQLPEGRSQVRLEFSPVRRDHIPQQEPIHIHWYGRSLDKRDISTHDWTPDRIAYQQEYEGGLLEIEVSGPQVLRVYRQIDAAWQEITPDLNYLRLYKLDAEQPIRYTLVHMASQDTPLRIDLRGLSSTADEQQVTSEVDYRLLDDQGEVLRRGKLSLLVKPSLYDRLAGDVFNELVTEPSSFYFRLPGDIAAIELRSHAQVWVNAYTRPMNLVRRVRIPEDYYRDIQDTGYQPAWFIVTPDDERQLVDGLRTAALNIQRRPPVDDPDIVAGRYEWEEFRPEGRWRGRHLLVERASQLPIREEAMASLFYPVVSGRDEQVRLHSIFGRETVTPSLVYLRQGGERERLSLFLDERLFFQTSLAAPHGQIRLPAIDPGVYRLRLESSGETQWFINHIDADRQPRLRRFGNRLGSKGMVFVYHKRSAGEEVLTGQFFSTSQSNRAGLSIKVARVGQSLKPQTAWTFTDRFYDLRIGDGDKVPILGAQSQHASAGVRFFLPLGEDLEPGKYRIHIEPSPGVEGYLSFYRLNPGESVKTDLFVERG
ncbi:MAG: hypothetical protein KME58_11550 [Candidatus Thiodiazotropha sp. (ex Lucina pensylvanica)]|nr:hypothetical protein [Candidatus Thiodiazotropha sp. (ex Lucina pensylvanica)]